MQKSNAVSVSIAPQEFETSNLEAESQEVSSSGRSWRNLTGCQLSSNARHVSLGLFAMGLMLAAVCISPILDSFETQKPGFKCSGFTKKFLAEV